MSEPCVGGKHIRAIDRLFVSGLGPWRLRRLRSHLAGCPRCRAYYDKVSLVWRAMGPGAMPREVAGGLADDLIRDLAAASGPPRARWPRWLAAAAGVAGAAVALQLTGLPARLLGRDGRDWQVRGTSASRTRGVRAFCLGTDSANQTTVRTAVSSVRTGPVPSLRCGVAEVLQFAYSLGDGQPEYLELYGRDEGGAIHWYAPSTGGAPVAMPLTPSAVDEPLPASVRLSVNHRPGAVAVHALFSTRPIGLEEIQRAPDPAQLPGVEEHQSLTLALDP